MGVYCFQILIMVESKRVFLFECRFIFQCVKFYIDEVIVVYGWKWVMSDLGYN